MNESSGRRTFTHPSVLAQNVSRGAFTLVRAHHVDTAEGTQQRILGALVDVCARTRKKHVVAAAQECKNTGK